MTSCLSPRASIGRPSAARWALGLFVLGPIILGFGGCSSFSQGPNETLRTYARALEASDVDTAYALLSSEAKRSVSRDRFSRLLREHPDDLAEVIRTLSRPTSSSEIRGSIRLQSGDVLGLVFERGAWRIDANSIDLYAASSPREALNGFVRAFERKRYDVLLRYVAAAEREGVAASIAPTAVEIGGAPPREEAGIVLTEQQLRESWEGPEQREMRTIIDAIKASLPEAQIEEVGDSASMSYGAGQVVALVREDGLWRIRDF